MKMIFNERYDKNKRIILDRRILYSIYVSDSIENVFITFI